MCMEILSRLLDKAANEEKFGYHPKCQVLNLTHLIFANDLVIFSDGSMHSLLGIKTVLDICYNWSGLKVSFGKK